jgi:hypothetical protein
MSAPPLAPTDWPVGGTPSDADTIYVGVGARATPPDVESLMRQIASALTRRGWQLRTGGARGADQAFLAGAGDRGELYLPWSGFQGHRHARRTYPTRAAYRIAAHHHPAWERQTAASRALLARTSHVVLGADLDRPATMLICWTPDGSLTGTGTGSGGTGQALRLAAAHRLEVINLAVPAHRRFAATFLTRP